MIEAAMRGVTILWEKPTGTSETSARSGLSPMMMSTAGSPTFPVRFLLVSAGCLTRLRQARPSCNKSS